MNNRISIVILALILTACVAVPPSTTPAPVPTQTFTTTATVEPTFTSTPTSTEPPPATATTTPIPTEAVPPPNRNEQQANQCVIKTDADMQNLLAAEKANPLPVEADAKNAGWDNSGMIGTGLHLKDGSKHAMQISSFCIIHAKDYGYSGADEYVIGLQVLNPQDLAHPLNLQNPEDLKKAVGYLHVVVRKDELQLFLNWIKAGSLGIEGKYSDSIINSAKKKIDKYWDIVALYDGQRGKDVNIAVNKLSISQNIPSELETMLLRPRKVD